MNAMTGSYPRGTVDFSKSEVLSSGTLEGVDDPANSAHTVSQWEVEWTDNSGIGAALATDKVYLLLVKDGSELTGGVKLCSPVNRSVGISVTTLPAAWAGQTLSQYLIIVSLDGQRVSIRSTWVLWRKESKKSFSLVLLFNNRLDPLFLAGYSFSL